MNSHHRLSLKVLPAKMQGFSNCLVEGKERHPVKTV